MYVFIHLIHIWLISESTESVVYGPTYGVIGNFKDLNPKTCGITGLTKGIGDDCFKWHETSSAGLKWGRDATMEEAPWLAFVSYGENNATGHYSHMQCGGALIANKWVLTAEHCFKSTNASLFMVYLGSHPKVGDKYNSKVREVHPAPMTDLMLLELDTDYKDDDKLKSICLPAPDVVGREWEYAMTAGWGQNPKSKPIQMGYQQVVPNITDVLYQVVPPSFKLRKGDDARYDIINMIFTQAVDNQTYTCTGDSGSPLWQFDNGLAVLIGTDSYGIRKDGYTCTYPAGFSVYVRISGYIDWIKNITKLQ